MKRAFATLIGLALYVVLSAASPGAPGSATPPAHPTPAVAAETRPALTLLAAAGDKCATCQELLQSCRAFCGTTHVNSSCDPKASCAGTCSCQ